MSEPTAERLTVPSEAAWRAYYSALGFSPYDAVPININDYKRFNAALRAAYAVDFGASSVAPEEALREAHDKLVRAAFLLTTKTRLVETDRVWCGTQFSGAVYGVRPEDWKEANAMLDEVELALRAVLAAPEGEYTGLDKSELDS